MQKVPLAICVVASIAGAAVPSRAANLFIVSGAKGPELRFLRAELDKFEIETGNKVSITKVPSLPSDQLAQYRLWLEVGNSDVDVFETRVTWAPQLVEYFLDLTADVRDVISAHIPATIASQTVDGKLVALPYIADTAVLYYRKDLLAKYAKEPPKTWDELAATAKEIEDRERAAGNKDLWGYVFQADLSEGLTCQALEWLAPSGGGRIVESTGDVSVDNPSAAAALTRARDWIGAISPEVVLDYDDDQTDDDKLDDGHQLWQAGNAVFMRNGWGELAGSAAVSSAVRGKFDVVALPASAFVGWNMAVSKYSKSPRQAVQLVRFLASPEAQKAGAIALGRPPTLLALYDDPDIAKAQPILPRWKSALLNAVPLPSVTTKVKYSELSFATGLAVHDILSRRGSASGELAKLQVKLTALKGAGW